MKSKPIRMRLMSAATGITLCLVAGIASAEAPAIVVEACNLFDNAIKRERCLVAAGVSGKRAASGKPQPYAEFVATAKQRLEDTLLDPATAQWRRTFVSRAENGQLALCGEVNAKNQYGGYVGFRSFYVAEEPALMDVMTAASANLMGQTLPMYCGQVLHRFEF